MQENGQLANNLHQLLLITYIVLEQVFIVIATKFHIPEDLLTSVFLFSFVLMKERDFDFLEIIV